MLTVLFHKETHAFVFISLSISSNTAFSERCSKIVPKEFHLKVGFHSHINLSNIGKRKKVRETRLKLKHHKWLSVAYRHDLQGHSTVNLLTFPAIFKLQNN